MKTFLLLLLCLTTLGAGCVQQDGGPKGPPPEEFTEQTADRQLTGDFLPETEASASPESDPMIEGPWNGRFMTAVSRDGLTWNKTSVSLGAQLNVPDLVYGPDGTLYLYFAGYTLGEEVNKTAVAISEDDGQTWIWKYINWIDKPGANDPGDPTVLYLEDEGVFRMWATMSMSGENTAHWLDSTDGITFTYQGQAFDVGENAIVPSVLDIGGTLHLYTGDHPNKLTWHGVSDDKKTFEFVEKLDLQIEDDRYPSGASSHFAGNAVPADNGYRMYTYGRTPQDTGVIGSVFSQDGSTWESEGVILEVDLIDLETDFVKDPAVIQRPDGSWFMVYATNIPE